MKARVTLQVNIIRFKQLFYPRIPRVFILKLTTEDIAALPMRIRVWVNPKARGEDYPCKCRVLLSQDSQHSQQ